MNGCIDLMGVLGFIVILVVMFNVLILCKMGWGFLIDFRWIVSILVFVLVNGLMYFSGLVIIKCIFKMSDVCCCIVVIIGIL